MTSRGCLPEKRRRPPPQTKDPFLLKLLPLFEVHNFSSLPFLTRNLSSRHSTSSLAKLAIHTARATKSRTGNSHKSRKTFGSRNKLRPIATTAVTRATATMPSAAHVHHACQSSSTPSTPQARPKVTISPKYCACRRSFTFRDQRN